MPKKGSSGTGQPTKNHDGCLTILQFFHYFLCLNYFICCFYVLKRKGNLCGVLEILSVASSYIVARMKTVSRKKRKQGNEKNRTVQYRVVMLGTSATVPPW